MLYIPEYVLAKLYALAVVVLHSWVLYACERERRCDGLGKDTLPADGIRDTQ
jgi:hypothetical protein